jgi:hypothetical protein
MPFVSLCVDLPPPFFFGLTFTFFRTHSWETVGHFRPETRVDGRGGGVFGGIPALWRGAGEYRRQCMNWHLNVHFYRA